MSETTRAADDLRVVRKLLWEVLSERLHPAERQEVKSAIGAALIEENLALFAEAEAYSEILGDVHLDTEALLSRRKLCSTPLRTMVESEVQLLLERLHKQSSITPYGSSIIRERDPASVIPQSGNKEKDMLTYINSSTSILQQASTSDGRPRTPHSTRPSTASSSRPATASSSVSATRPITSSRRSTPTSAAGSSTGNYTEAGAVLTDLGHEKLNVGAIDVVSAALRAALEEEREALTEDVEYLQALLQDEAERQHSVQHTATPSIHDLREYTIRLSEAVEQEEARVDHESRVAHMFEAADGEFGAAGRLRSMVGVSRKDVLPSKPVWAGAFDQDVAAPFGNTGVSLLGDSILKIDRSTSVNSASQLAGLSNSQVNLGSLPSPASSPMRAPHRISTSSHSLGINTSDTHMGGSSSTFMPPPPSSSHPHPSYTHIHPASNGVIHPHPTPLICETSRPSSREETQDQTGSTLMAVMPVIGTGPMGILRHLSASRGLLNGVPRPLSPASLCSSLAEQSLLQKRSLGSSLGGLGPGRATVLPHLTAIAMQGLTLQSQNLSSSSTSPSYARDHATNHSSGASGSKRGEGIFSNNAFVTRDVLHNSDTHQEFQSRVQGEQRHMRSDLPPSSHQLRPLVFAPKEASSASALIRSTSATDPSPAACFGDKNVTADVGSSCCSSSSLSTRGILHTRSLTDRLHAEVDAVQGGVAAILLKHGHVQAVQEVSNVSRTGSSRRDCLTSSHDPFSEAD